jgi:HD-like signal output (HDOD) protein
MTQGQKMEDKKKKLARQVAELIEVLPPMPENISRLMNADAESPKTYSQVRNLIEIDPGLCSDLLHLASALCRGRIETIDEAVERIGICALVQFIGISFARKTIAKEFSAIKCLDDYFEHSRDISLCCQFLADFYDMPSHQKEMYAVAGLIHDIGRLIILVASNKKTVHLMGTSWDKMKSIVDDEKEILGLDHCEVGMQLCRKWKFAPILQEIVLRHHTPLIDGDFSFAGGLIFIAHFVSFSDMTGAILSTMLGPELLDRLHISMANFTEAQQIFQSTTRKRR